MSISTELETPNGIHHAAYRCRDAEQTRWFYQDVLGLRLAAAFEDELDMGEGGRGKREFLHIFFELPDGSYLAFFDEPAGATDKHFHAKDSFDVHIAIEAQSMAAMQAWQAALNERGILCMGPVDHGFVQSIYMLDPNGLPLEITCKVDGYEGIMQGHADEAADCLAAWTEKTRALKESRLDVAALDFRA